MTEQELIHRTEQYVRKTLKDSESGHNWFHIERVWKNAKQIGQQENVNMLVVQLAALLHDIADSKFYHGDETIGPKMARSFLEKQKTDTSIIDHVIKIMENISFRSGYEKLSFLSTELQVVQDADRLDAIGAIGIARAFHFGGYKNREIYDPAIPPDLNMTKEAYKKSTSPTINHFYEKLLLLKDKMNTITGKRIAEERHIFMETYLQQFFAEWNGEA
ncbi:MAG: HD domain-containing protein [Chitinophagaceae bacterium]|nr:HD domain-containing protein [Chitinophagaceae bacterium]